jgi:hypothetical protein
MRQFLDQLPRVIATKPDPLRAPAEQPVVARALEATLHLRQATIVYHSKSSERIKTYLVHPYRLAYAQGGLYLLAYVPEYGEVRTFAVERIHDISLLEDRFTPIEELPDTAFPHSLGVHSGPPERVEIDFQPGSPTMSAPGSGTRPTAGDSRVRLLRDDGQDLLDQRGQVRAHPHRFAEEVVEEIDAVARDIAQQIEQARAQYP